MELSKKKHTSFVSVQYLATDNRTSILKRFKEDILKDRVKLLDFVQSAFKKEEDEDAPIEGTATEGSERKETDVQMVQEHTDVIVENVDTAPEVLFGGCSGRIVTLRQLGPEQKTASFN